jgi:hypothetical protein
MTGPIFRPHSPPSYRREFQPNGIDVFAVDWLIYRSTTASSAATIPEIRLVGIFPSLVRARQAAGFGSLEFRVLRENRLSSADLQAIDARRRELQREDADGHGEAVIPVIRRCEYFTPSA